MRPSVLRGPDGSPLEVPDHRPAAPPGQRGSDAPAAAALTEKRPWDLFLVLAAALLVIAHSRFHVFIPGTEALRPALMLGLGALALWVAQKRRIRSIRCFKDPVSRTVLFFAAWAVVTVPLAAWPGGAARNVLDDLAPTIMVFVVVVAAVRNLEDVRRLVGVMAFGVGMYAVLAPRGDGIEARGMHAGGYDPNDAAMLLVSGLPLLLYFILFGRRIPVRVGAAVGLGAVMVAVVDTGSRGGFLSLLVLFGFMTTMLRGVSVALRVAVVAVAFLAMIPVATTDYWERVETIAELDDGYGEQDELSGRWAIWGRGVEYWMTSPVTGVGLHNYSFMEGRHPAIQARIQAGRGFPYRSPHSHWMQTLAELGIVGLVAFALAFFHCFKGLRGLQRPPPEVTRHGLSKKEVRVLAGALMGTLLVVLTSGSFLSNAYAMVTWGPWAMVAGLLKVMYFQGTHRERPTGAGYRGGAR